MFKRRNPATKTKDRTAIRRGEARFKGKKKDLQCQFDLKKLPKGFLLVGELEELECETPKEAKVDSMGLVKSKKPPLVIASGDGKVVAIVSNDKVSGDIWIDPGDKEVKQAIDLHKSFHGVDHDSIKKVNTTETDWLVFWGHLNHIVYSVPKYSARYMDLAGRKGIPFIHEAKDRGEGVPPAEEKPIVCISPKRDFLVMYGVQFEFTERGIIG